MNFLVDAQLPPGLTRWLIDRGHSAVHVDELQMADAEDGTIWDYALEANSIIITKDEDFAERTSRSLTGPVIVWLRVGNSTNRALFRWLEPRWEEIKELLESGNRLIEVR